MDAKLIGDGSYVQVDDQMTFANPTSDKIANIEWMMRHAPQALSHGELRGAASVISSYRELMARGMGQRYRDRRTPTGKYLSGVLPGG